jgi:hypothetical protein
VALSPNDPALTPDATSEAAASETPPAPQTAEEVEAIWRNRFSQRDRAHNAEIQSLKEQMDDLKRSSQSSAAAPADGQPADGGYKARYEQLQRELESEKALRAVDARRGKYPALGSEVAADDPMWTSAKDETLARLNAQLSAPPKPAPTGHIDPNNPAKTPANTKKLDQMTADELKRELQRLSPAEQARMDAVNRGVA